MSVLSRERDSARSAPGFAEFVLIVAIMMSIGAFSIDNIMPAFGAIQRDFSLPDANELQLLMTVYMIGFALTQLLYGPASDSFGRRPVFMLSMALYLAGSVAAAFAPSYDMLLAARVAQGLGAASTRVVSVALVRDRYAGREMARVMSMTMMVFILTPIFAPAIGSLILLASGWRAIFAAMMAMAAVVTLWFFLRMPETLKPEYRQPFSAAAIGAGFRRAMTLRVSFGYATAMAVMFGVVMSYVNSAQQIFETEVYGLGRWFPAMFGAIAATMGLASFLNAKLVRRLGMRRLSHGGTLGFLLFALIQLGVALLYGGRPPLTLFALTLAGSHFLFSLMMPNFNAMAMEPLGDIAGAASSIMGFYTTLVGAGLGFVVGQSFDGTVTPLAIGYFSFAASGFVIVLWTERWKLFRPQHADPR